MMTGKRDYESSETQYGQEKEMTFFEKAGRNKKGAAKGSIIAIVVLAVALMVALIVGAGSILFILFRSESKAEISRPETTYDLPAQTQEPDGPDEEETPAAKPPAQTVSTAHGELTTQEINEKVGPATVSILAEVTVKDYFGGEQSGQASGSGFIISEDGYVVTNAHVVEGAQSISVKIPSLANPVPAELMGADARTDIAVLKIDETDLPVVELGSSSDLAVGERAIAIGNPFGTLDGTLTQGVISALDREITIGNQTYNLLQTDASINSGNSGGPLLNGKGQVIGVTNAKVSSGEGIGFAIPIDDVKEIIDSLITYGYVTGRPIIGIQSIEVTQDVSDMYGLPLGIYVRYVEENSPAEKAGFHVEDIIIEIDGEEVLTNEDLLAVRDAHSVGDVLVFTVVRERKEIELELTLEENIPVRER